MRKSIIILFSIIFFISCVRAQTDKITGVPENDLSNIFESQIVTVDIMDGIKSNPRLIELTQKIQLSLQNNIEWYQEYIKTRKKGETLEYHPNLGITKDEYIEFLKISKQIEFISSDKEELEIIKTENRITFKSKDKLSVFNDLIIDLIKNQILYKEYTLPFIKQVNIEDAENGLKSKWKGYNWAYEFPTLTDEIDLTDLENLNLTIIKFTVGQLERNGKIFVKITERSVENGVKTIDSQIPILF